MIARAASAAIAMGERGTGLLDTRDDAIILRPTPIRLWMPPELLRLHPSALRLLGHPPCVGETVSPVQHWRSPLLTTMAQPLPRVTSRCCFETSTGAACTRFVVKMRPSRECVGREDGKIERTRFCLDAAVDSRGPEAGRRSDAPSIGAIDAFRATTSRQPWSRRQRYAARAAVEHPHDGILPACRNWLQAWQSVTIFSGPGVGTIETRGWTK